MIDSTLFMCDVPAATYAYGDVIPMSVKSGPIAVRSGYGDAVLKEFLTGYVSTPSGAAFEVVIQNSNMIDPVINSPSSLTITTGMDPLSSGVQSGHDMTLDLNSTWNVYAKCVTPGTIASDTSMFALIDIDYPSVGSVTDPLKEQGIPTSLEVVQNVPIYAFGSSDKATWTVVNVDNFKPGFKYLMEKIGGSRKGTNNIYGFVGFANAAAQQGLSRIVPLNTNDAAVAKMITYAEALTKGPMDYRFMFYGASAGNDTLTLVCDFVKRAQ